MTAHELSADSMSATAGALLWGLLVVLAHLEVVPLSEIEQFVALAVLVFVPLGLGLAATPRRSSGAVLPYTVAVSAQFPAALAAVGSLLLDVGSPGSVLLVVPWLGLTGLVASIGVWRVLSRVLADSVSGLLDGLRPLPALAVDAALLYLPAGSVALLLHRSETWLIFKPIIVLLTAVHYHYAGFVLPLVTGLVGRELTGADDRFEPTGWGGVGATTTVVIIVNLGLIAVGISFSPLVEVTAVAFFTVAVALFAVLMLARVVPSMPRLPGGLLACGAVCIFLTMALALAYGYSAFRATGCLITIEQMITWHGTLNAFGFALPGLLCFRLLAAKQPSE